MESHIVSTVTCVIEQHFENILTVIGENLWICYFTAAYVLFLTSYIIDQHDFGIIVNVFIG